MTVYRHAYYWRKGLSERKNPYTLAEESVMTGAGPVFLGLICDSEEPAKQMVGWFYKEVLPLIRERGLGVFVRNSFLRHFSGQNGDFSYGVVILFKKRMFFASKGNFELVKIAGRKEFLLCNSAFADCFQSFEIKSVFGKKFLSNEAAEDLLNRLGRRAAGRGCEGSVAVMYVAR